MSLAYCPTCQVRVTVVENRCLADHPVDPSTIQSKGNGRRWFGRQKTKTPVSGTIDSPTKTGEEPEPVVPATSGINSTPTAASPPSSYSTGEQRTDFNRSSSTETSSTKVSTCLSDPSLFTTEVPINGTPTTTSPEPAQKLTVPISNQRDQDHSEQVTGQNGNDSQRAGSEPSSISRPEEQTADLLAETQLYQSGELRGLISPSSHLTGPDSTLSNRVPHPESDLSAAPPSTKVGPPIDPLAETQLYQSGELKGLVSPHTSQSANGARSEENNTRTFATPTDQSVPSPKGQRENESSLQETHWVGKPTGNRWSSVENGDYSVVASTREANEGTKESERPTDSDRSPERGSTETGNHSGQNNASHNQPHDHGGVNSQGSVTHPGSSSDRINGEPNSSAESSLQPSATTSDQKSRRPTLTEPGNAETNERQTPGCYTPLTKIISLPTAKNQPQESTSKKKKPTQPTASPTSSIPDSDPYHSPIAPSTETVPRPTPKSYTPLTKLTSLPILKTKPQRAAAGEEVPENTTSNSPNNCNFSNRPTPAASPTRTDNSSTKDRNHQDPQHTSFPKIGFDQKKSIPRTGGNTDTIRASAPVSQTEPLSRTGSVIADQRLTRPGTSTNGSKGGADSPSKESAHPTITENSTVGRALGTPLPTAAISHRSPSSLNRPQNSSHQTDTGSTQHSHHPQPQATVSGRPGSNQTKPEGEVIVTSESNSAGAEVSIHSDTTVDFRQWMTEQIGQAPTESYRTLLTQALEDPTGDLLEDDDRLSDQEGADLHIPEMELLKHLIEVRDRQQRQAQVRDTLTDDPTSDPTKHTITQPVAILDLAATSSGSVPVIQATDSSPPGEKPTENREASSQSEPQDAAHQVTTHRVAQLWDDDNPLPITEWSPNEAPIAHTASGGRRVRRTVSALLVLTLGVFLFRFGWNYMTDSQETTAENARQAAALLSDTTDQLGQEITQLTALTVDPAKRVELVTDLSQVDSAARSLFEVAAELPDDPPQTSSLRSEGAELSRRAFQAEADISQAMTVTGVILPLTIPPDVPETAPSEEIPDITVNLSWWVSRFAEGATNLPSDSRFAATTQSAQELADQLPDIQQRYITALREGNTQRANWALDEITHGLTQTRNELDQALFNIGLNQREVLHQISADSRELSLTSPLG